MLTSEDIRFFAVVAAERSLAAAARTLGVSPPAVTQRLRALEQRTGAHLVDRTGRLLSLTAEGELLVERGREVIEAIGELDEALIERRGQVAGLLRIIAPFGFGRRYVAPVAAAFQERYPQVTIDLTLSDRLGVAPAGAWDLAIHVGETHSAAPNLIMRNLARNARLVCAAPAYLERHGVPTSPKDLRAHACIALRENDDDVTLWRFLSNDGGPEQRVRIQPQLASNDGEVVHGWALAGRGIIVRSEWDVIDDLRSGRLVQLLKNYAMPDAPVVALLGSRRASRAYRTERFLDALATALNPAPWSKSPKSDF
ncbi:DNA-binding transcriptional LysR family regulator [Sphingomonas sp. UYAg733]